MLLASALAGVWKASQSKKVTYLIAKYVVCFNRLDQFDEFLLGLLNYFACFFDKLALERKPKPMAT